MGGKCHLLVFEMLTFLDTLQKIVQKTFSNHIIKIKNSTKIFNFVKGMPIKFIIPNN